jgi:hypothetical protein
MLCSMSAVLTRPEVTSCVAQGAQRLLRTLGYSALSEVRLRTGRRVDLLALGPTGEMVIVEVKSGVEDFRADAKWQTYAPFCDRLFFAVDEHFPQALLPLEAGVMVADRFGGAIAREAPHAPLPPARRKAMTLGFARLAAARLSGAGGMEDWALG